MARRRATPTTATATTPRGAKTNANTNSKDRTLYTHNLWLNYLKPVSLGLVFSPSALRAAQIELPLQAADAQRALEALTIPRPATDDESTDNENPPRTLRSTSEFLTGFLDWKPNLLDVFRPSPTARMFAGQGHQQELTPESDAGDTPLEPPVPDELRHDLPQYDDTLEPSFAYRWPQQAPDDAGSTPWCLLGLDVPPDVDLDRKPPEADDTTWVESPQKKFERLLYETGIPLGLIVQGTTLRLVYRPEEQQSGYITFPLDPLLKPAGRLACSALKAILSHQRIHQLPSRQRLHHILAESRKFQNEVSTQLAEQVLAALFELLKGFEAADEESRGLLLRGLRDRSDRTHEIYEGLLTVLMRLVFLLYAEEREMFPADALFMENYSIAGLFARLVEDEARHPDTMDQRYGAWAHLVALFRLVYGGVAYEDLSKPTPDSRRVTIPARHGDLFRPDRFPFLEGPSIDVQAESETETETAIETRHLPRVPDGTILRVLRNLLYLKEERLSYRSLEVEQIGSVYEAIMGYRVETARGRSVAIRPEKRNGAPVTVDLEELLAAPATKRAERFKKLTDRKLPTAAATALRNARSEDDLAAALDRLIDRRLTPAPVPAGSLVFQPSPERRRSGSHYTPRTLTGPIVTKALEPILRRLGPNPTPEAILALKVCDPAMGSGAFLVEAMRQLARLLVEAWSHHGNPPRIPADETPILFASRLIAQRCLYGVDKNRMAMDLAKLSLWLATLAKDHAFSFLDHNFRHGDSLVGLSLAQIEACHWAPDAQQGFVSASLRHRVAEVLKRREQILTASDFTSYQKLSDLRVEADKPLDFLRFLGDAVIGVFFEGGTASAKERRRDDLSLTIRDYLNDAIDMPTRLVLRREIEQASSVLQRMETPLDPFHWEVEFPEVFLGPRADGSLERQADGGFDAIVGNPPFMGGRKIRGGYGVEYLNWLTTGYLQSKGNADIVAFFYRRAYDLLREEGVFGLIATNTIGQGDTRSTGLRWICNQGGTIYAARKRVNWPGEAAVVVSVVHIHKGGTTGPIELDGHNVPCITAFLFHSGGHEDPTRLHANLRKSFVGSYILGMGFTFDDTDKTGIASPITLAKADELAKSGERTVSMEELIATDPRNQERIFPYIGGKEVNDSPTHANHRYVINFNEMTELDARRWPSLMKLLELKVRPERLKKAKDVAAWPWWQHWRSRSELYSAIREQDHVLVAPIVTNKLSFTFISSNHVFTHKLMIFKHASAKNFSILQSSCHDLWARFTTSTMKDDLNYSNTDCFETFPFPDGWETNASLEAIGQEYYDYRAQLMAVSTKGLTKTYNRFHDPKERSPEIVRLRDLHTAMDRAVLAAYGWPDIDTTCGFDLDYCESEAADDAMPDTLERLETGRYFFESAAEALAFASELEAGAKLPWRYRWRPEVRDEVLARLLLLNKARAESERLAGLTPLADLAGDDEESVLDDEDVDDNGESDDDG